MKLKEQMKKDCLNYLATHERNDWACEDIHESIGTIESLDDLSEAHVFVKAIVASSAEEIKTVEALKTILLEEYQTESAFNSIYHLCKELELDDSPLKICDYEGWTISLSCDDVEEHLQATHSSYQLVLGFSSEGDLEESVSAMETFINEFIDNSYQMAED